MRGRARRRGRRVQVRTARGATAGATRGRGRASIAALCLRVRALGASFALFARRLADRGGEKLSAWTRWTSAGTGSTRTADDRDLSLDTMARDVADVCARLYRDDDATTNEDGNTNVQVVLVGHSMAARWPRGWRQLDLVRNLRGVVVIDVVENAALASVRGEGDARRRRVARRQNLRDDRSASGSGASGSPRRRQASSPRVPRRRTRWYLAA